MLTPKQRQFLKGLAHGLSFLLAHELIKVRIEVDSASSRRSLAEELARAVDRSSPE